jgi:lipopolysaccharide transport system permease protein
MKHPLDDSTWDVVIEPHRPWWRIDLRELWQYRDLLALLTRRDLVAVYKQSLLGSSWQVLQPLLTAVMFAVIFGLMARLSTPGIPPLLFYMAAVVPWTFFANVVNRTSGAFITNAALMTKVFYPRLISPLSTTLSTAVNFLVQLGAFFLLAMGYRLFAGYGWGLDANALMLPILVLVLTLMAMGLGIIVAALTTKFRDLTFLVTFGVHLLMFMSPVIFPLSLVPSGSRMRAVIELNPMTAVIEGFRASLLGTPMDWYTLLYPTAFALVVLVVGIMLFQRIERSFADLI